LLSSTSPSSIDRWNVHARSPTNPRVSSKVCSPGIPFVFLVYFLLSTRTSTCSPSAPILPTVAFQPRHSLHPLEGFVLRSSLDSSQPITLLRLVWTVPFIPSRDQRPTAPFEEGAKATRFCNTLPSPAHPSKPLPSSIPYPPRASTRLRLTHQISSSRVLCPPITVRRVSADLCWRFVIPHSFNFDFFRQAHIPHQADPFPPVQLFLLLGSAKPHITSVSADLSPILQHFDK